MYQPNPYGPNHYNNYNPSQYPNRPIISAEDAKVLFGSHLSQKERLGNYAMMLGLFAGATGLGSGMVFTIQRVTHAPADSPVFLGVGILLAICAVFCLGMLIAVLVKKSRVTAEMTALQAQGQHP